ncbi:hypothetical protein Ciccas_006768 [Cichlidogyrus casuarinus]|uniref:HP domain-containing protein n=1 Tax=Cichlidogyrus casuarinus TaxID=1844966 RepID=A0ABD2Q4U9_9PLAT
MKGLIVGVTLDLPVRDVEVDEQEDSGRSGSPAPRGINWEQNHMSDKDFETIFDMDRRTFSYLPEWKRNDLKRRVFLF